MGDSHTAFIGSIPEHYDQYLGPLIFEEYAIDLAQRLSVPAGGIVLEIAAGTGIATRHLRKILPDDVKIVITDLNESMLEYARHKFNAHHNLEFKTADASGLSFPAAFFAGNTHHQEKLHQYMSLPFYEVFPVRFDVSY